MATDISKVGNVVQVTEGEAQPKAFAGGNASYSFNAAGDILNISFGGINVYAIEFEDLTIGSVAPADTDAAYTALSTVFPSEGGGSGTTPDLAAVLGEGNDAGGEAIINVGGIVLGVDGGVIFVDTTVPANTYKITIANGELVITLQGA